MIATWWADLSPVMRILWGVTLTASLIFVIQTILTFIGADADAWREKKESQEAQAKYNQYLFDRRRTMDGEG